ncbi:MAG: alpha-E domain-containing protein [Chloroflexi bacterium]|nr:alpha-E domain-containing protein [Chloroflexota bacterium]
MLSRVAENLYWLGRYLERAENVARMAEVNYNASVEQRATGGDDAELWTALIGALDAEEEYAAAAAATPGLSPGDWLIFSEANPNSLRSTVSLARSLARELREHLSREVFEEINLLYLSAARAPHTAGMRPFTASVKRTVAAIVGLFDNTVLLNEGREWLRCGLFIERADMTSRIVDAKYFILLPSPEDIGGTLDTYQWMGILRSASALEAFRKRYRGAITGVRVAELLLLDDDFPRSLRFCVSALIRHFERATEATPRHQSLPAARELALLQLDMGAAEAEAIVETGLHEFLDLFQARLARLHDAMTEGIFLAVPTATSAR